MRWFLDSKMVWFTEVVIYLYIAAVLSCLFKNVLTFEYIDLPSEETEMLQKNFGVLQNSKLQ